MQLQKAAQVFAIDTAGIADSEDGLTVRFQPAGDRWRTSRKGCHPEVRFVASQRQLLFAMLD